MLNKKRAFSLIELSMVILVIGIITAGIMKGVSIVRTSRISAARQITTNSKINEIPGMIAWYETSMKESFDGDESIENAQITGWNDISPESIAEQKNQLTTSASANVVYRTLGINSLPSVQFTSSGNLTLSNFFQGAYSRFTIFVIFQPTVTVSASYMTLLDAYSGASSNYALGISTAGFRIIDGSSNTQPYSTFTQGQSYAACAYINDSSSKAYVNDTETSLGTYSGSSTKTYGLTVGTDENIANAFTGFISEIIIYNRVISEKERKAVMTYLGQKYNIKITGAY